MGGHGRHKRRASLEVAPNLPSHMLFHGIYSIMGLEGCTITKVVRQTSQCPSHHPKIYDLVGLVFVSRQLYCVEKKPSDNMKLQRYRAHFPLTNRYPRLQAYATHLPFAHVAPPMAAFIVVQLKWISKTFNETNPDRLTLRRWLRWECRIAQASTRHTIRAR